MSGVLSPPTWTKCAGMEFGTGFVSGPVVPSPYGVIDFLAVRSPKFFFSSYSISMDGGSICEFLCVREQQLGVGLALRNRQTRPSSFFPPLRGLMGAWERQEES